ncbi:class I SAM-dependent methyltransferase [Spirillospora sp. CA-294931]|uniref:class I SAM-dependent methyltransferase n=1 Tax=Spirillospora sp. CA-294931 TaxID=3240042 RepID=UPI003D8CFA22
MVWLICLLAACMTGNALRLRHRLTGLHRLPPSPDPDPDPPDPYALVTAEDVSVPEEVRRAADRYARDHDLGMLDLVPADLPVDQALDLAKHLDFRAYRRDVHGMGRGACHAVLARPRALAEARGATAPDPAELGELTTRLRFSTGTADMVVAPISALNLTTHRRALLRSLALIIPQTLALPQTLGASAAGYTLVVLAIAAAPLPGACLAVLYSLLPYLVFGGTAISPRDLHQVALGRMIHTPLSIWRTLRAPRTRWERTLIARREHARTWYRTQIEAGIGRFLGPRRDDCPWCGSRDLRHHVTARDVLQGKPGRFTLERCARCRHIFQNPRVTPEGLDFYYKDVYDGLGDALAERILSSTTTWYLARARLAREHLSPRAWLDVGTGRAHFCRAARRELPGTRFDGLDQSAAIDEATARGWIGRGYRGAFLDYAPTLTGTYDIVSMFHYLEHTADPLAELDAAAKILPPGGHLLIEMPDPASPFARILRGFWVPYLAPQHLHLIPIENLKTALELRGLRIVAEQHREADQGPDFITSAAALLNWLSLDVDRPWWPRRPGRAESARVFATLLLAAPLMATAIALDLLTYPLARRHSNAYRILARRDTA